MNGIRDKCAIVGIGNTAYTRNSGVSVLNLAVQACKKAIDDSGLPVKDIDGIVTYNMSDSVQPQEVAACLGLPSLRYHSEQWGGGPLSCQAVATAAMAIVTGMATNVVVFRAMNGRSGRRLGGTGERPPASGEEQFFIPQGWTSFAHGCAIWHRRHMSLYGTTAEQTGEVAVTCRKHASMNERAMSRTPISIQEYLESPMIVEPFRVLDICLETDGACALIVTSAERAKDLRHSPIYIMAAAHGGGPNSSGYSMNIAPMLRWREHAELGSKYIAEDLFRMAQITHADIDIAEIYDEMTIAVIIQLEDYGFCMKGEGGAFVEGGRIQLGGELPVNTHGGLLSEAYIHGLNHVVEAVSQLRGDANSRQVKDAEIALCTGVGGATASALILRR